MAAAAALGSMAAAAPAGAQSKDTRPVFRVELATAQPGASIHLDIPGSGVIACGERCVLTLPRRAYHLYVTDAYGNESMKNLSVQMPSQVSVTPADPDARRTGTTLMSFGAAGIVLGGVALYFALVKPIIDSLDSCGARCAELKSPLLLYGGAAAFAAGVALGTTGLIVWRKGSRPHIDVKPLEPANANGASMRVTPAAGARWAGLALTGRF